MSVPSVVLKPQSKAQERFLSTRADIAIYGGAAFAGKSFMSLMEGLRHINNPYFSAVIFRRTYPEITNPGGLWDKAMGLYPLFGGRPNKTDMSFLFPSGAKIVFRHLQHRDTVYMWQGSEIPLIIFDELTHFEDLHFWYMLSRNRSLCGVRPYIRGSCNPDPDSFVAKLVEWYIDVNTGYAIPERSGVLRYFARLNDVLIWDFDALGVQQQVYAKTGKVPKKVKSFTFIPATMEDNPVGMANDPDYEANLEAMVELDYERLRKGNWKIRPSAGKIFDRNKVKLLDTIPFGGSAVRFWDFAATEKKLRKDDPDYTSSCLMLHTHDGKFVVLDVTEERLNPEDTDARIVTQSKMDIIRLTRLGYNYMVRWEEEGGASGKRDTAYITRLLMGYDAEGIRPQGDKLMRGKPLAVATKAGNLWVIPGDYTEGWLTQLHNMPEVKHDDQWDSTTGSFNALNELQEYAPESA